MKHLKFAAALFTAVAMGFSLAACGEENGGKDTPDNPNQGGGTSGGGTDPKPFVSNSNNTVVDGPIVASITGQIGEGEDDYVANAEATVSLNALPATERAFDELQAQIGDTPQGGVMMVLAAMEVWANAGPTAGNACLKKCVADFTITEFVPVRLNEMFSSTDKNYARPYQVAAFLVGAERKNGYNPTEPYTASMYVSPHHPYSYSSALDGTNITFQLRYQGSGSESSKATAITVVKPYGQKYYLCTSWSSLYVRVAQLRGGEVFNGFKIVK